MDELSASSAIFQYHRGMMAMHGMKSPLALGWRDVHSQQVRFGVLADIGDMNNCSLLDAGCGYGGLLSFLLTKYPQLKSYTGTDFIPEMIENAIRNSEGILNAEFLAVNFMTWQLPTADYVLACGSLNYASNDPAYIYKAINRLFDLCKIGVGFNLLRKIKGNGILTAYDKNDIEAFCKTLSKKVKLINDYDDEDLTVFMYH